MVPEAAGAKLGAPFGAVVVVLVLVAAANGPLATSDTATRAPTTRAGRRAWFTRRTVLYICVSFLLFQAGQVQSLRNASMGARRAARDAG